VAQSQILAATKCSDRRLG